MSEKYSTLYGYIKYDDVLISLVKIIKNVFGNTSIRESTHYKNNEYIHISLGHGGEITLYKNESEEEFLVEGDSELPEDLKQACEIIIREIKKHNINAKFEVYDQNDNFYSEINTNVDLQPNKKK
jgi:hypothetical protein